MLVVVVLQIMVRTIGSGIDYKSSEFNSYLVTKSHN